MDLGNADKAPVAAAAAGVRPPRPSNWGTMKKVQCRIWKKQEDKKPGVDRATALVLSDVGVGVLWLAVPSLHRRESRFSRWRV